MASSFITKDQEHGFWISDAFVQVVCWGFVSVIDDSTFNTADWMKGEFRKHMYNTSQGLFVGFSTLSLYEYVKTPEHEKDYCHLIEQTRNFFMKKGLAIPIEELNEFQKVEETRRLWKDPFASARVDKILDFIEDVINDKMKITADAKIDYNF